jgi:type I site-specific restriction endonuclease
VSEADTCRKLVVPKLLAVGWDTDPHSIAEQRTITDGRIVPVGKGFVRKSPKRVDFLLRYTRDFPLAVVEAKADYKAAADGVQQAKIYAEMLGLKFDTRLARSSPESRHRNKPSALIFKGFLVSNLCCIIPPGRQRKCSSTVPAIVRYKMSGRANRKHIA